MAPPPVRAAGRRTRPSPRAPRGESRRAREATDRPASRSSARTRGSGPSLRDLVILVVEDQPDQRELLRLIIEHAGARVLQAEHGVAALQRLAMPPLPDVILCDLLMPELDGLQLAREIATNPAWRGIPILAVTALGAAADYIRTWTHGFAGHLVKPIDPDELIAAVRQVARNRTA